MTEMDWQRLIDLGVMTPGSVDSARSSALTNALFQAGAAFSRAGAPSRTPGGQPLNLAPVFTNYQNSLANSMKQGLMMQMLERKEKEYKRKETQRKAITAALTPMPVTRHVPIPGQYQMVTDLGYEEKQDYRGQNMPRIGAGSGWMKEGFGNFNPSQAVRVAKTRPVTEETNPVLKAYPANIRPLIMALAKGGAGKKVMEAMVAAGLRPTTPYSALGKLAADFKRGRITEKEFKAARAKLTQLTSPRSTSLIDNTAYISKVLKIPEKDALLIARQSMTKSKADVRAMLYTAHFRYNGDSKSAREAADEGIRYLFPDEKAPGPPAKQTDNNTEDDGIIDTIIKMLKGLGDKNVPTEAPYVPVNPMDWGNDVPTAPPPSSNTQTSTFKIPSQDHITYLRTNPDKLGEKEIILLFDKKFGPGMALKYLGK